MTPYEFVTISVELYGKRTWQIDLADSLGVDQKTVQRWASGAVPIRKPIELALRYLRDQERSSK